MKIQARALGALILGAALALPLAAAAQAPAGASTPAQAHRDLEGRKTTGSTVLVP